MTILPRAAGALAVLFLAGCVANPKSSLPVVQREVATRTGLEISWPQSAAEKADADRTVESLATGELTPDSAARIAVLNNRRLRATFEDLGVSQAELVAAGKLANPTIGAGVRWPDQHPRGPNVEFTVAAELLDSLLLPIRKKVAQERLGQVERRVAAEVLSLAAEVKAAAYTVQAGQQFRVRLEQVVAVNEAAVDLAQRQYDAGNITELELVSQKAAAHQAALELLRLDAQLRSDREKLTRLLGLPPAQGAWKMSAELAPLATTEITLAGLEDLAVTQRLDLAVARSEVDLAARALRLKQKTRFLPASVNLGVGTERESGGERLSGPHVEFTLPIFDQGQAELARLGAEFRRATANYEALESEVRSEARTAGAAVLAARDVALYYARTLVPQRRFLTRETLLHNNAMQKSNYELLAAKERQLATEREGIEALRDYWIALAQLEKALGGRIPAPVPASANP